MLLLANEFFTALLPYNRTNEIIVYWTLGKMEPHLNAIVAASTFY